MVAACPSLCRRRDFTPASWRRHQRTCAVRAASGSNTKHGVEPAERERAADRHAVTAVDGRAGRDRDLGAGRVRPQAVECRWNPLAEQRVYTDDRLECRCGAERVPRRAFRTAHERACAEHAGDRRGLHGVVELGARRVAVDVPDVRGRTPALSRACSIAWATESPAG